MKDCIIPLVEDMMHGEQINNYFFILYDEKGYHIRLRLKSIYDHDANYNYAKQKIETYFKDHPSSPDINRNPDYFPVDSIQLIPYQPEYYRYGGIYGVEIAEEQFLYSSNIVFGCIKNDILVSYVTLLNLAFKLHLTTAFVYCEKIEDAIHFFRFIYYSYTGLNNHPFIQNTNNTEITYSNYYNSQKTILIPYVKTIWNSFISGDVVDENIEQWKNDESRINNLLGHAYRNNKLELPFLFENYPFWSIVQSYIHLTNNRLGIKNSDEPLIAYLLMRSLMDI